MLKFIRGLSIYSFQSCQKKCFFFYFPVSKPNIVLPNVYKTLHIFHITSTQFMQILNTKLFHIICMPIDFVLTLCLGHCKPQIRFTGIAMKLAICLNVHDQLS